MSDDCCPECGMCTETIKGIETEAWRLGYQRGFTAGQKELMLDLLTPPPDVGGYKPRHCNGVYREKVLQKKEELGV